MGIMFPSANEAIPEQMGEFSKHMRTSLDVVSRRDFQ